MARKLRHEDSRAVDLLLDRAGNGERVEGAVAAGSLNVKNGKGHMKNRLHAAERVLRMLDYLPTAEPSTDLVRRTLQRIDEAPMAPWMMPRGSSQQQPFSGGSRPHA
jgi:hypothetical protein